MSLHIVLPFEVSLSPYFPTWWGHSWYWVRVCPNNLISTYNSTCEDPRWLLRALNSASALHGLTIIVIVTPRAPPLVTGCHQGRVQGLDQRQEAQPEAQDPICPTGRVALCQPHAFSAGDVISSFRGFIIYLLICFLPDSSHQKVSFIKTRIFLSNRCCLPILRYFIQKWLQRIKGQAKGPGRSDTCERRWQRKEDQLERGLQWESCRWANGLSESKECSWEKSCIGKVVWLHYLCKLSNYSEQPERMWLGMNSWVGPKGFAVISFIPVDFFSRECLSYAHPRLPPMVHSILSIICKKALLNK